MNLKFKNPPINELVIGVYFSPPLAKLRAEHIGLFWSKIQERFPHSQNAAPIGRIEIGPDDIFPLPRFWFLSEDDSTLIQIQKNAFLVNWRKRESTYPHYDNVKKEFDKNFGEFVNFLKTIVGIEDVFIDRCELSYINNISASDFYRGLADVKKIIPSFSFPDTGLKTLNGVNIKTSYKVTENTQLTITIQNRVIKDEKKQEREILYYELRTSGKLAEASKSEADRWFEKSHDIIGSCFMNMVSEDAQKTWELKEA